MAWYPGAERRAGNSAGSFTSGPFKGVLHTTEGKSVASAFSAYTKNNSWPHFTVTFEGGAFKCYQHVDTSVAARSLKNETGGVQTNRDSAIQIEIVGTCDVRNRDSWGEQYVENFPTAYLDGIAALMRWIEENTGIARNWMAAPLKPYPDSYGAGNGVRLSQQEWDYGTGWCGHQNVPENYHGDPGLINIEYLLGAAIPVPTPTPPRPPTSSWRPESGTTLERWEYGPRVKDWQGKLNYLTGTTLDTDGYFGEATLTATLNFQKFFGLVADGIVGQKSQDVMTLYIALKKQKLATRPTLRYGDKGDHVRYLQSKIGFVTIDGVFGNQTLLRVKKIQRLYGLTQDGIVGPKTWSVVNSL